MGRPDDIELGDDVIEVERKPRAGVVVSVRLSPEEADQLQAIAERRGVSLSRVAREALSGYLMYGPDRPTIIGPWSHTIGLGGHFEPTGGTTLRAAAQTTGAITKQTITSQ
jgi:hypothetical protein